MKTNGVFSARILSAIAAGAMLLTADIEVVYSQGMGINNPTPHISALLDLTSTTRGFLVPRMTTAERDLIGTPATSLLIFNLTTNFYNYYNGISWVPLFPGPRVWNTEGNFGTIDGTHFIGTTDNVPFAIRVNNLRSGYIDNTNGLAFFGYQAGLNNASVVSNNTAFGNSALLGNTYATQNVAVGRDALFTQSFANLSTPWATDNVAVGYQALYFNQPTASTNGLKNTAIGNIALYSNTTGIYNTAVGWSALGSNTTGSSNTASGVEALRLNTTGSNNTASGYAAGDLYTDGTYNTFLGYLTDVGAVTLSNCVAISGNGNLAIAASNTTRIGNASMASIGGQVGWTTVSDARSKINVQENVPGISFIKELRPVTYFYDTKKENELMGISDTADYADKYAIRKMRFSGFLAQEVEQAANKLGYEFSGVDKTQLTKDGKGYYGLRYAEFTVPLVKAVQEQQAIIDSLKLEIGKLEAANDKQQTTNNELKTEIERIKTYLEMQSKK